MMRRANPLPQPVLLTVQEACQLLRISRWTFYQLVNRRELLTVKIGSRRLVPAAAIDMLIRARSSGGDS